MNVNNQEKDWWDNSPQKIKNEIDEALDELDKGKGISHETLIKKYAYYFQVPAINKKDCK